ncbi:hypothetical protein Btru_028457 [Bulinus truncatus]|nr:hypothetical protein Btru_028457 [Bulinus truncatus]
MANHDPLIQSSDTSYLNPPIQSNDTLSSNTSQDHFLRDIKKATYVADTLGSLLHNLTSSFHEYRSTYLQNNSISFEEYFQATFPLANTTFPGLLGFNLTSPVPSPSIQDFTDPLWSDRKWTVTPFDNNTQLITGNVTERPDLDRTTAEIVFISVVVSLLAVLTAGGNMLVIVAFKLDKNLQTVSNYFLLSLAVADLTIGIVSMPLYTVYLLMGYWPLKALMCDVWLSLDYTMSNASVANLIIISFDRYLSVTRPLTYRAKRTPRRAATMICCAWIISSLIWTPWIFAWPYIEGERTVPENECFIQFLKTNQYITVITAMFAFYIPVMIMSVLYFRIYMETQKRQKDLPKLQGMHKSKRIKDPHQRQHNSSKKSMASSDEEGYSSTSDKGYNLVTQNSSEIIELPTTRSKLLGCLKIDRDSDYMEDSSSSEPQASPHASNTHSTNTLPTLGAIQSNGGQGLPRQDSENSTTSLQAHYMKPPKSVRINFSTSLIPLLPVDTPNTTYSVYRDMSIDTLSSTPEQKTLPPFVGNVSSTYPCALTTSFSDLHSPVLASDTLEDDRMSCEANGLHGRHQSDSDDEDDHDTAMFRVLIHLPDSRSVCRPTIRMEPEEDLDRFSEINPSLVQRNESDSEDEDDVRSRRLPERPILPPPVRPRTGTPALARRAQSSDSNKIAQQAKIAERAATRVLKAKQTALSKLQARRQERRQDQKAAKTLTAILLAFIVTWTPYNIFTVVQVFCDHCVNGTLYAIGKFKHFTVVQVFCVCCVNATVYVIEKKL